tara:strand:+ start:1576 stop:1797 length:222 start_codon:yes stop_codon:yes gene_type:complete
MIRIYIAFNNVKEYEQKIIFHLNGHLVELISYNKFGIIENHFKVRTAGNATKELQKKIIKYLRSEGYFEQQIK